MKVISLKIYIDLQKVLVTMKFIYIMNFAEKESNGKNSNARGKEDKYVITFELYYL